MRHRWKFEVNVNEATVISLFQHRKKMLQSSRYDYLRWALSQTGGKHRCPINEDGKELEGRFIVGDDGKIYYTDRWGRHPPAQPDSEDEVSDDPNQSIPESDNEPPLPQDLIPQDLMPHGNDAEERPPEDFMVPLNVTEPEDVPDQMSLQPAGLKQGRGLLVPTSSPSRRSPRSSSRRPPQIPAVNMILKTT